MSDGENLERLWSFLGKFCHMTKEMNAANTMQHYAKQKSAKMGKLWTFVNAELHSVVSIKETSI